METKDKIIIVYYINIAQVPQTDVIEFISKASENLTSGLDNSVLAYIIPTREGENKIDCINPVTVNKEDYETVKKKLDELKEKLDLSIKELRLE